MPNALPLPIAGSPAYRCVAGLSQQSDTETAAHELAGEVRAKFGNETIDLACLFFSGHHIQKAGILAEVAQRLLQPRVLIGCSGEGIIAGSVELETAPGITLWAASLPAVTIEPLHLSFSPAQDQFRLHSWPSPNSEKASLVVFADPFTMPVGEALCLLDERYPGAPAIGGLAGGGRETGGNRLIFQGEAHTSGLVGVRLSGSVAIRPVISQGCRLVGERFIVTRAERNVIHELGGAPALQRLQTIFEALPAAERHQAHRALHLGIAIDEHRARFGPGDYLVRNLVGADEITGSIAIGDLVQEGQTVQFHLRDAQSASEDLHAQLAADQEAHRRGPLGALMFSCCGRGQGLFGKPHHDAVAMVNRFGDIPVAGFFAQGEIGPVGGRNFLHSYTASMAIFDVPERTVTGSQSSQVFDSLTGE